MNPFIPAGLPLAIVYQDNYCRINIAESTNCIFQCFHQLPKSRDLLKPSMDEIIDVAKKWSVNGHAVFYFLEVEDGQLLPSEDITWVRKDVLPLLADAGIRFIAYVSQNNLFRRFSHEMLTGNGAQKSLSLRVFQDRQDALLWLNQIQQSV